MIIDQYGDILTNHQSNWVGCTINIVGAAGVGIAKSVRDKHPDWYYEYKRLCRTKQLTMDNLFIYSPEGNHRYKILSMPTKDHFKNKSRLDQISRCIEMMHRFITQEGIKAIDITRPGCGYGGLSYFDQVKPILLEYFEHHPCKVTVWYD